MPGTKRCHSARWRPTRMIQSTSGSPWGLVMGWVCLAWPVRALWGRFIAARKRRTVVWDGGWYSVQYCHFRSILLLVVVWQICAFCEVQAHRASACPVRFRQNRKGCWRRPDPRLYDFDGIAQGKASAIQRGSLTGQVVKRDPVC